MSRAAKYSGVDSRSLLPVDRKNVTLFIDTYSVSIFPASGCNTYMYIFVHHTRWRELWNAAQRSTSVTLFSIWFYTARVPLETWFDNETALARRRADFRAPGIPHIIRCTNARREHRPPRMLLIWRNFKLTFNRSRAMKSRHAFSFVVHSACSLSSA
jgi:hypothetical protein